MVFTNLNRWIDWRPPPFKDKGKKHPLRIKVKAKTIEHSSLSLTAQKAKFLCRTEWIKETAPLFSNWSQGRKHILMELCYLWRVQQSLVFPSGPYRGTQPAVRNINNLNTIGVVAGGGGQFTPWRCKILRKFSVRTKIITNFPVTVYNINHTQLTPTEVKLLTLIWWWSSYNMRSIMIMPQNIPQIYT